MAKLTVAGIRQQIAALEAKAVRLAEDESKASVAKVRSLMDSLGVTIEHLSASVSKKMRAVKTAVVGKKSAPAKRSGAGAVRYRDPATGATWSGFGRAPAWIASAANREEFAVGKAGGAAKSASASSKKTTAKKAAAKKAAPAKKAAASKKVARAAAKVKTATKKAAGAVKRAAAKKAAKPAGKSAPAKNSAARKAAPRKAVAKKASPAAPTETATPEASADN